MGADDKWLVKSSDIVFGPYKFDTVVENIFNGEIHLLDEIKGPFERWRPIKDHSLFAAAIEKLKATAYLQRENTITATVDLGTKTHELTRSYTGSVGESQTLTPIIKAGDNQKVVAPEARPIQQTPGQQTQVQPAKRHFSGMFFLTFLLLIIFSGGYLVYEFQQTKRIQQQISAYDQLTDNALLALKTGAYQEALKSFTLARNISPNDPNLLIEMAPLSVQFDGQFSQTQVLMEKLLATKYTKDFMRRGKNVIGLTYSYRAQYGSALKSYDAAIGIDDQFLPPYINKAFVLIKLNKANEAVDLMRTVVSEYPEEAIAHYMYIRSLVENGLQTKNKIFFEESLSVSNQFAQNFSDFKQEVLFLNILAKLNLEASTGELEEMVNKLLKIDIELTNLHVHNTLIDFQSFNWFDYVNGCQKIISKIQEYPGKLLEGFCFLKINRTIEAKKIFEALLSQQSNDGVLQALYASSLLKLNDLSKAKNVLGFINQVDQKQPVVETILRGCLRAGDLSCGEAIFKGRHAKHISLLYSHWGNSEINFQKDRRKTKKSTHLGLEMSPNFAPLLMMKEKL